MQGVREDVTSFWGDLRQSTNNFMNTESIDDELAKKISNVFQTQYWDSPRGIEITHQNNRNETN